MGSYNKLKGKCQFLNTMFAGLLVGLFAGQLVEEEGSGLGWEICC